MEEKLKQLARRLIVMAFNPVRENNLVVSLVPKSTTGMRITETDRAMASSVRSGAVSLLGDRQGDVYSTMPRSTPPSPPTSSRSVLATRTTTTRTTSTSSGCSADCPTPLLADFSSAELLQAYYDARASKRYSRSALEFEFHLERNLYDLDAELRAGTYRPGSSICFVITRPKPREVWAAPFRDRVVHHLLYNRVSPRIHARFIANSCACIQGRGTMYGAQRLEKMARSITQNWTKPARYLKCDLSNFFVSIDKSILGRLLERHIDEPWWRALALQTLFHDPREDFEYRGNPSLRDMVPPHKRLAEQSVGFGLPIGNLSSQFFANVYLNELDQFVKHQLHARHYIRYVDDLVILSKSQAWLSDALEQIEQFLANHLNAQLNPKKTIMQPVHRGIDFVGQTVLPHRRGHPVQRDDIGAAAGVSTKSSGLNTGLNELVALGLVTKNSAGYALHPDLKGA